jgi:hypothetical protein
MRTAGKKFVIWKWLRRGHWREGRGIWKEVATVKLRSGVPTEHEAEARAEQEAEAVRARVEARQRRNRSDCWNPPPPVVTDGTYPQFPAQTLPGSEPGSDNFYPQDPRQALPGRDKPRGRYVAKTMDQPDDEAPNGHTAVTAAMPARRKVKVAR